MSNLIQVTRSSLPTFEEYIDEIRDIWDTAWLTNMGKKHNELTQQLKEKLEVPYISLFTNGHMALELAIQAFQLSGEVITTPYTFASTTHAIIRNGLKPVFCDIDPDTYTIDANKIEELITDKTSAIIPVHVYGNICDVEKIEKIAKKHNLVVIYDAAHAFYETYKGKSVASFGDASMFSFHATKMFNTIEGGAIATFSEKIDKKLYKLKNFGIENAEVVNEVGSNAKMNEFQAAMGLCNLRHIEREREKRRKVVERYREYLDGHKGIVLCTEQEGVSYNYSYFPVVFRKEILGFDRNYIFEKLKGEGIFCRKYFYPLVSDYDCYRDQFDSSSTPIAKEIADSVLTLPLYADLALEDVDRICKLILEAL